MHLRPVVAGLLFVALSSLGLAAPVVADAGGAVPGVPRLDGRELALGHAFGCVIVDDGSVRCWGENVDGELAQGNTAAIGDDPGESTVPVNLGVGRTAVAITAGVDFACALLDTGQVRCWGHNNYGQLAQGNTDTIGNDPGETPVPVDLGPGRTAVAVSSGDFHTCAILDTGQVRCWGGNTVGQLAQGNEDTIGNDPGETTVPVDLAGHQAVDLDAGAGSTCVILDNGGLRCWGMDAYGQMFQQQYNDVGDQPGESTVPINLGPGRTAVAVSVAFHICAILDDGGLRCWGYNSDGQLGQGGTTDYGGHPTDTTLPLVPMPPGRTVVAVSQGNPTTCAILDNGQLRCWGRNAEGELGQGDDAAYGDDPGEHTLPVGLDGAARAVALGAYSAPTCAVTASGLRCWGPNDVGQLGQGSKIGFGTAPGEVPTALPPVGLGGHTVGRDRDADGVRDAVDACPTTPGTLPNGCAPRPEAILKRNKVILHALLVKPHSGAHCPAKAAVTVKTRIHGKRITVHKQLKAKSASGSCLVRGKVKLPAKPKRTAKVKVKVAGKKLRTKHLLAVRL